MPTIDKLVVALEANDQQFSRGFDRAEKRFASFRKAGVAAAGAVAAAVVVGAKKSLDAFDTQAKAEASLLTALKGREDIQQRLIQQAGQFQRQSLFGDEEVIAQQAYLASLQLTEQQINDVLAASIDLAAGTGGSLESAVRNLSKTYSGLTGELGESIPQLRELTAEQLKAGEAIDVVAQAFDGQAAAAAAVGSGPLVQLQNAVGDIAEVFGGVLQPALSEAAEGLLDFAQAIQERLNNGTLNGLQAGLVAAVEAVRVFIERLGASVQVLRGFFDVGQGIALLFQGRFKEAAEQGGQAIDRFGSSFERFLQIGDDVSRVTGVYADTLEDLEEKQRSSVQVSNQQTSAFRQIAQSVGAVADQVERLNTAGGVDSLLNSFSGFNQQVAAPQAIGSSTPGVEGDTRSIETEIEAIGRRNEALQDSISITNELTAVQQGLASAGQAFGETLVQSALDGKTAFQSLANGIIAGAKEIVRALVQQGIAAAVSNAITTGGPLGVLLAPAAGAAANAIFNSLLNSIPAFGDGGIVFGPTLALVGEKGPERITPLGRSTAGDSLNVNIRGLVASNALALVNERTSSTRGRRVGII